MTTTVIETTRLMTTEVPVVAGDVLRAIDTPAVSPPSSSPPTSPTSATAKKGHRRTSSAASDIAKAAGIDIEAVTMSEARKIMSEEHKILGFRPPHGSFAAEIQSVASKHPEGKPGIPIDTGRLKEMAREDALKILADRKTSTGSDKDAQPAGAKTVNGHEKHVAPARHSPPHPGVNLNTISATDARILMSHEHRALGFRPPPGSLAAEAQSAAARHPEGDGTHLDDEMLRQIAIRDAERIKADRELNMVGEVNVSTVGKEGAAAIVSAEAQALGHRPPAGSLAAQAQSAAVRHPEGGSFNPSANPVELEMLTEAARKEGEHLREEEERERERELEQTQTESGQEGTVSDAQSQDPAGSASEHEKVDIGVETGHMTDESPNVTRTLTSPPLNEMSDEIVGDVSA